LFHDADTPSFAYYHEMVGINEMVGIQQRKQEVARELPGWLRRFAQTGPLAPWWRLPGNGNWPDSLALSREDFSFYPRFEIAQLAFFHAYGSWDLGASLL
jgi:hypothetical protein